MRKAFAVTRKARWNTLPQTRDEGRPRRLARYPDMRPRTSSRASASTMWLLVKGLGRRFSSTDFPRPGARGATPYRRWLMQASGSLRQIIEAQVIRRNRPSDMTSRRWQATSIGCCMTISGISARSFWWGMMCDLYLDGGIGFVGFVPGHPLDRFGVAAAY